MTFKYTSGTVSSIVDNSGRTVNYTYDSTSQGNRLIHVTHTSYDPNADVQYGYSSTGGDLTDIILSVSNSLSNRNHNYISYGTGNRVASLTVNSDPGYGYSYIMHSNPGYIQENKVNLPDGTSEYFYFDAHGYLTEDERAPGTLDEITLYNRSSLEQVSSIQQEDPSNNYQIIRTESYLYNAYDDVTSVTATPGPGNTQNANITYNYQAVQLANGATFDELTSVVDPLQNTTSYGYDPAGTGNVLTVTDPLQRVWRYSYYMSGEVETATDPKQNPPTQYTYTSAGDLQSVTDPLGHITKYGYIGDQLGRVTSVTAPAGDVTQYAYDALDDVTSTTDPNNNVSRATYDLLGEIASRTDPKGNTTTYTRPYTLNKLTACDALNKCEVTDYDPSGNTSDFTDRNNLKTVIVYDKLRRITNYEYQTYIYSIPPYWSTTREVNLTNYDALDRPLAVTDDGGGMGGGIRTSGNTINYVYDTVDNVMSEATAYTTGGYTGNVSYTYNKNSRPTSISENQNGQTAAYTYCYDNDSELVNIYSGVGAACTGGTPLAILGYDNDGNRGRLTVAATGSPVITGYGYDAANRLKSQSFSAGSNNLGSMNYFYDLDSRVNLETGTLANLKLPSSVSSISYTATNQINNWNGTPTTPDAASNLTLDPSNNASISWDERNFLSAVNGGPAGSFAVQYDAKGRRENDTGAFTGTNYYLDDKTKVAFSTNVSGSSTTPSGYVIVPGTGEVLSFTSNGTPLVPLHDYADSTFGLVGSSNTLQTQWSYEPFGAPTQTGTASSFPFLFGGAQYDPTGYYGSYSPRLAHSLSGGTRPYTGQENSGFGQSGAAGQSSGGGPGGAFLTPPGPPQGSVGNRWGKSLAILAGTAVLDYFTGGLITAAAPFITDSTFSLDSLFSPFGLLGGGGHSFQPPPHYYQPRKRFECDLAGVSDGLCADQSPPHLILVQHSQSDFPSRTPSPTPSVPLFPNAPDQGNAEEIGPNGVPNCCCGPSCGIPPGTPDWAIPRMQQLLEQGLTWEEARETLQHEIDSGKLKNPNVIPAP